MITDISLIPTSQLRIFLEKTILGYQRFQLSDSNDIVVFKKKFDVNTGLPISDECIASVPLQNVIDNIKDSEERIQMIRDFLSTNNLTI